MYIDYKGDSTLVDKPVYLYSMDLIVTYKRIYENVEVLEI